MKLYGLKESPFTRKVLVVLEEKGLGYELVEFGPFPKRPELMEKHPMGMVPILEDGEDIVPDSSVICAYLERLSPSVPVYPESPRVYAKALFLEEYVDTAVTDAVGPIFRERFVKPRAHGEPGDEEVVRETIDNVLPPVFDYLENLLTSRSTLLETFSVADAALGSTLTTLLLAEESVDAAKWPKLAAYHKRLLQRPSFQASLPEWLSVPR